MVRLTSFGKMLYCVLNLMLVQFICFIIGIWLDLEAMIVGAIVDNFIILLAFLLKIYIWNSEFGIWNFGIAFDHPYFFKECAIRLLIYNLFAYTYWIALKLLGDLVGLRIWIFIWNYSRLIIQFLDIFDIEYYGYGLQHGLYVPPYIGPDGDN